MEVTWSPGRASYKSLTARSQYNVLMNSHQPSQAARPPEGLWDIVHLILLSCSRCLCFLLVHLSKKYTLSEDTKQEHTILTACWFLWTLQCSLICFRKDPLPLCSIEFFRIQLPSTALNFSTWFRKLFDVASTFILKIHCFVTLSCKKIWIDSDSPQYNSISPAHKSFQLFCRHCPVLHLLKILTPERDAAVS